MEQVTIPVPEARPKLKKSTLQRFLVQWDLQILVIPSILLLLVFAYIPMFGIVIAFQDYRLGDFPGLSEWAGLRHFRALFNDPNFSTVMRNTLVISGLKIFINFPLPILFAVMVGEIRWKPFKRSMQTVSYLPHFISWVVTARLMFEMFSPDGGIVNNVLVNIGLLDKPLAFFNRGEYYWGINILTDLWKELGWNSIIFFAAIAAIDSEIYEAASIDGASRIQSIGYITIPAIKPTILLLLIFTIGGLLNANFDQSMQLTNQMTNAMLRGYADVIDTYVYRVGISQGRFSFGAAAGLFKAGINIFLLVGANYVSNKVGESGLF